VEAAKTLYPDHLTLAELFTLIEQVRPPREFSGEGFGYAISDLYELTPKGAQRSELISRLAELCLSEPFVEWHQRISARYVELAKHVEPIARSEVQAMGENEPPQFLIRLLMAVERAEREHQRDQDRPTLAELVHAKPKILRALFWADVAEQRARGGRDNNPAYFWQVTNPHSLWRFDERRTWPAAPSRAISASH
jgi:hypothetical protein